MKKETHDECKRWLKGLKNLSIALAFPALVWVLAEVYNIAKDGARELIDNVEQLNTNVIKLDLTMTNLINATDKISKRVDDNAMDIKTLDRRVTIVEGEVKYIKGGK